MDLIIPTEKDTAFETEAKTDVLKTLEGLVKDLMAQHLKKRRLWFSSDFLPADEQMDEDQGRTLDKLRERARGIVDAVRVAVAVNLLTEEGLPHFHRVFSNYLGNDNVWSKWNFLWTAEEDRHGTVLRDYVRDTRLFRFREVEMMQHAYNVDGFTPGWDQDPYRVFVYTTLQERATQFSHRNTGRLAGKHEPTLKKILDHVAADEARHFTFYRHVFKAILDVDPNRALQSALAIMPGLQMPGVAMPHFREMADVVRRTGIYSPWDYKQIVEEALAFWKIELLTGLNEAGRKAQDKIMAIPARLQKVAEYVEQRSKAKTFSFSFLNDRLLEME